MSWFARKKTEPPKEEEDFYTPLASPLAASPLSSPLPRHPSSPLVAANECKTFELPAPTAISTEPVLSLPNPPSSPLLKSLEPTTSLPNPPSSSPPPPPPPPPLRTSCIVSPLDSIAHVRSHLTAEENAAASDEEVCRYIRATKGDLAHSIKRLKYSLEWHATQKPHMTICSACEKIPGSHYMHTIGYDKQRRPIIYSCFARASNHVVEDNRVHMIQAFAEAIGAMPAGVENWTWITDFYGFSTGNLNPGIARAFLHLAASHYPERLGMKIVLGAPKIFSSFWAVVRPFVDEVSKRKMKFWPYKPDELRDKMSEFFDEPTISWLLEEMRRNRAQAPSLLPEYKPPEAGCLASWDAVHDCRGTRQFAAVCDAHGLRNMVANKAGIPAMLPPHSLPPT